MKQHFGGSDLKHLAASLAELAWQAGEAILMIYQQTGLKVHCKADESPVTEADFIADEIIRSGLLRLTPGVPVWSEESDKPSELNLINNHLILVDPLDGTREFIKRNGEFTVNIAVIENGLPIIGIIHAPALQQTFLGIPGVGAFESVQNNVFAKPIACTPFANTPHTLRVLGSRSYCMPKQTQWLKTIGYPSHIEGVGSALKFCRIAQGLADLYPRFGPTCQWDTAAGQAIVEAAGGQVCNAQAQPLRYGLDRDVLNQDFLASGPFAKGWLIQFDDTLLKRSLA